MFSFEIEESSLSDARCLIQDVISPHWRNLDSTVAGNIETMSFEMKIWQWIRDIYYEWMIIKQSLCLCRLHWYVLPYSPMIWHHDKVVRQKRSGATISPKKHIVGQLYSDTGSDPEQ
jgi:hypothetical protein